MNTYYIIGLLVLIVFLVWKGIMDWLSAGKPVSLKFYSMTIKNFLLYLFISLTSAIILYQLLIFDFSMQASVLTSVSFAIVFIAMTTIKELTRQSKPQETSGFEPFRRYVESDFRSAERNH